MPEWVIAFAGITFPVLLLFPPLVTSFDNLIPLTGAATFSLVLWAYYFVIVLAMVLAIIWPSFNQQEWMTLGFVVTIAVLGAIAIRYVIKWTNDELLWRWMERLRSEVHPTDSS